METRTSTQYKVSIWWTKCPSSHIVHQFKLRYLATCEFSPSCHSRNSPKFKTFCTCSIALICHLKIWYSTPVTLTVYDIGLSCWLCGCGGFEFLFALDLLNSCITSWYWRLPGDFFLFHFGFASSVSKLNPSSGHTWHRNSRQTKSQMQGIRSSDLALPMKYPDGGERLQKNKNSAIEYLDLETIKLDKVIKYKYSYFKILTFEPVL